MSGKTTSPSPLIAAIRSGNLLAVRDALNDGANTEEADMHGHPGLPLRTACFSGNVDIVGELIRRGADIDAPGSDGPGMPLRLALRARHDAVVALLIEHGAEIPPDVAVAPQLRFNAAHLELLPLETAAPELPATTASEAESVHFDSIKEIDTPASCGAETTPPTLELLPTNESSDIRPTQLPRRLREF